MPVLIAPIVLSRERRAGFKLFRSESGRTSIISGERSLSKMLGGSESLRRSHCFRMQGLCLKPDSLPFVSLRATTHCPLQDVMLPELAAEDSNAVIVTLDRAHIRPTKLNDG
jgi:hypothetical protein